MKTKLLNVFLFFCSTLTYAQFERADYLINGNNLPYRVMFPANYDETKQYPLVVFLHGSGERGDDNEKQLINGKDFLIDNFQSECPAIVIVPQCPANTSWSNLEKNTVNNKTTFAFVVSDKATPAMETLIFLISDWLNSGKVNRSQVYVGGLSMGGMGTYELLWRMPNTFAAAFPICGGGDISKVQYYTKNTAVWIFHGAADDIVPVQLSQQMYEALKSAGNEVKYTEYPGVNHGSWVNAFQDKDLVPWLMSHKK